MQMIDNMDLLYLSMVGVFLIASILLLFWNRAREKMGIEENHAPKIVSVEKSHLQPGSPEILKQNGTDVPMEDQTQEKMWYYSIDGINKHGPITEEELQHLLSSRRLLPDTLVWTQELPYWNNASSCNLLMNS